MRCVAANQWKARATLARPGGHTLTEMRHAESSDDRAFGADDVDRLGLQVHLCADTLIRRKVSKHLPSSCRVSSIILWMT